MKVDHILRSEKHKKFIKYLRTLVNNDGFGKHLPPGFQKQHFSGKKMLFLKPRWYVLSETIVGSQIFDKLFMFFATKKCGLLSLFSSGVKGFAKENTVFSFQNASFSI